MCITLGYIAFAVCDGSSWNPPLVLAETELGLLWEYDIENHTTTIQKHWKLKEQQIWAMLKNFPVNFSVIIIRT